MNDEHWLTALEREKAIDAFLMYSQGYNTIDKVDRDSIVRADGMKFRDSQEFTNARHAYRRRING